MQAADAQDPADPAMASTAAQSATDAGDAADRTEHSARDEGGGDHADEGANRKTGSKPAARTCHERAKQEIFIDENHDDTESDRGDSDVEMQGTTAHSADDGQSRDTAIELD